MPLFGKKTPAPQAGYGGFAPVAGAATYDIVGDVVWKKTKDGKFYPKFKKVHGVLNPNAGFSPAAGCAPAPVAYPAAYPTYAAAPAANCGAYPAYGTYCTGY